MSHESPGPDGEEVLQVPKGYVVVPLYMWDAMCRVYYGQPQEPVPEQPQVQQPEDPMVNLTDETIARVRAAARGTTAQWLDSHSGVKPRGVRARKLNKEPDDGS